MKIKAKIRPGPRQLIPKDNLSFLNQRIVFVYLCALNLLISFAANADGLRDFLEQQDDSYAYKLENTWSSEDLNIFELNLTSQTWNNRQWSHRLTIFVPINLKYKQTSYLYLTGSKDPSKHYAYLSKIATESGGIAAVVAAVPNSDPEYGDKEDLLLALSFKKYIDTGNSNLPALFPMVKSVVRSMDAISDFLKTKSLPVESFVVSGSSKRGWATYLTAASDSRVRAIVPIAFDMLNFKKQIELAKNYYGAESEKIKNYSKLGLIEKIDVPRSRTLIKWLDPFSYISDLSLDKLIVIGTNDPYWVVNSLSLYFDRLRGNSLVYQVPNGTHDIAEDPQVAKDVIEFYSRTLSKETLPFFKLNKVTDESEGVIAEYQFSPQIDHFTFWSAQSESLDFRNSKWSAYPLNSLKNLRLKVDKGQSNIAFFVEAAVSTSPAFKISSQTTIVSRARPVEK